MGFLSRIYNLTVNNVVDSFLCAFHKEQKQFNRRVLLCQVLSISMEIVTLLVNFEAAFNLFLTKIAKKFNYHSEKCQRAVVHPLNLSFVSIEGDSASQSQESNTQHHLT